MESATSKIKTLDQDILRARRVASMILNILDRHIPEICLADAHYTLTEALYKSDMELVSKLERKEYEALKRAIVDDAMKLPPLIIKDPD